MEAIIRTENKTLFEALLQFLHKLNFSVETRDEKTFRQKPTDYRPKKFNPRDYEGCLSHLGLDIERELINMRKGWKKNS